MDSYRGYQGVVDKCDVVGVGCHGDQGGGRWLGGLCGLASSWHDRWGRRETVVSLLLGSQCRLAGGSGHGGSGVGHR